ncbi:hypothetical protein ACFQU7_27360 [Pseudoroseomonas wenyumeiae]
MAWKTGTSWGGRDSWALGFDAAHLVGIWVGRPDGTPMVVHTDGATGTGLALPLLARAFALLPAAPRPSRERDRTPAQVARAPQDRLRLLFPVPDAEITGGEVLLRAAGGRRPLSFLVDGAPSPGIPARRDALWGRASPASTVSRYWTRMGRQPRFRSGSDS